MWILSQGKGKGKAKDSSESDAASVDSMMMDVDGPGAGAGVVSDFEELDSDEAPKAKSKAAPKAAPKTKKAAPTKKAPAKGKGKKAAYVSQYYILLRICISEISCSRTKTRKKLWKSMKTTRNPSLPQNLLPNEPTEQPS
jgi:hypothetical protein